MFGISGTIASVSSGKTYPWIGKNSAESVALSLHCFSLSSSSDGGSRAREAGGLPAPPGAGRRGGAAQPPRGRSALQCRQTGPLAGERVPRAAGMA